VAEGISTRRVTAECRALARDVADVRPSCTVEDVTGEEVLVSWTLAWLAKIDLRRLGVVLEQGECGVGCGTLPEHPHDRKR
jgi:hypothetical protein